MRGCLLIPARLKFAGRESSNISNSEADIPVGEATRLSPPATSEFSKTNNKPATNTPVYK